MDNFCGILDNSLGVRDIFFEAWDNSANRAEIATEAAFERGFCPRILSFIKSQQKLVVFASPQCMELRIRAKEPGTIAGSWELSRDRHAPRIDEGRKARCREQLVEIRKQAV